MGSYNLLTWKPVIYAANVPKMILQTMAMETLLFRK